MKSSKLHLILALTWVLLLIPSLTVWKNSILWLTIISIYANASTEWSAYEGARAKESNEESSS